MTRVHAELEGDTYFPVIEKDDWKLVSNTDNAAMINMLMLFRFSFGRENNLLLCKCADVLMII
jgi:dihydrofolate reductase